MGLDRRISLVVAADTATLDAATAALRPHRAQIEAFPKLVGVETENA
jgi:hypothetical protein